MEHIKLFEDFSGNVKKDIENVQKLIDAYMNASGSGNKEFKAADSAIKSLAAKHPGNKDVYDILTGNTSLVSLQLINQYKKTLNEDLNEGPAAGYEKPLNTFKKNDITDKIKQVTSEFEKNKSKTPEGDMTYSIPFATWHDYTIDLVLSETPPGSKFVFPTNKKTLYAMNFLFKDGDWKSYQPIVKFYSLEEFSNNAVLIDDINKWITNHQ